MTLWKARRKTAPERPAAAPSANFTGQGAVRIAPSANLGASLLRKAALAHVASPPLAPVRESWRSTVNLPQPAPDAGCSGVRKTLHRAQCRPKERVAQDGSATKDRGREGPRDAASIIRDGSVL